MKIYVMRHGIAEERGPGKADEERELTAEGMEKLEKMLRKCKKSGVQPSLILSSPLKRALQTAEMAARALSYPGAPRITETLLPEAEPAAVWKELRSYRDQAAVLLAGHEPQLSRLIGYLLGAPQLQVAFKKGAVACLETDGTSAEPKATLVWLLTPKVA